jgi:hypothetical protein
MKYRKKPVVIEAWQNSDENEFPAWVDSADVGREPGGVILINTLEGVMKAMPGDYIIKGVQGEVTHASLISLKQLMKKLNK